MMKWLGSRSLKPAHPSLPRETQAGVCGELVLLEPPAQVCAGAALFTQSSAALIKPWREARGGSRRPTQAGYDVDFWFSPRLLHDPHQFSAGNRQRTAASHITRGVAQTVLRPLHTKQADVWEAEAQVWKKLSPSCWSSVTFNQDS